VLQRVAQPTRFWILYARPCPANTDRQTLAIGAE
jgi:hypothetical protein